MFLDNFKVSSIVFKYLINYRCSLFVDQQIDRKIAINTLFVMVGQTIPVLTNRWIGQRTKISICKWTVDLG